MRYILAASNITAQPVLTKKFRGKIAKDTYRCGKGILLIGSIPKPIALAIGNFTGEMTKGCSLFILSWVKLGEYAIGYLSGVGFVRYL